MGANLSRLTFVIIAALTLAACEYLGLARPRVLSELTPPVVRLVNELPDLDAPNKALSRSSKPLADFRMRRSTLMALCASKWPCRCTE
jgi:hypothetical protein